MASMIDLLATRRSVVAQNMSGPGPDEEQLQKILEIAARVPDHGKLEPWRFIIFQDEDRAAFGAHLARAFRDANPAAEQSEIDFERARFERAPVVVAVVSTAGSHVKIPEWEQVLSAGAVCQNMLVAASAMGFASQWLTEWYAYDVRVLAALGVGNRERVAGFIYLGTAAVAPKQRPRPVMGEIARRWNGGGGS